LPKSSEFDGVIRTDTYTEQGHVVTKRTQPNRDQILRLNQEARKDPGALKHSSFGGLELSIPELDYYKLIRIYPELNSPDGTERTKAWRKFFHSAEAAPYRVRDRVRKPRGL